MNSSYFYDIVETMKVFLVEDEPKLASLIKSGLVDAGYTVDVNGNGNESLDRLLVAHEDYDIAILDRMLPGLEGLDICRKLREERISLPILMLTALGDDNERISGLNNGADDYMVKPFIFEELLARIRTILRRPRNVLSSTLKVDSLVLDTAGRQAWRGDRKLALTKKEFGLLELLMLNLGQVLDREQLMSRLWDYNFDTFSNVVDVHIKNLRQKVDKDASPKLIETIRGVGYRIKG